MDKPRTASLTMIYPENRSMIYVPMELNGRRGRTVFEAAHRDVKTTIHWHLDNAYMGSTRDIHQMALSPSPGGHVLTLVDTNGELIQRRFNVLAKE
jgi:penicillin-binding protein 1C